MNSRIAKFLSVTIAAGWLAVAAGCAVAPAGTETEKAPSASEGAAPAEEGKAATESSKVETESKAIPEAATCKAPLEWCTCTIGDDGRETWCTTLAACFRVCGDRT